MTGRFTLALVSVQSPEVISTIFFHKLKKIMMNIRFSLFSLHNVVYSRMVSTWITSCNRQHINISYIVEYMYLLPEIR